MKELKKIKYWLFDLDNTLYSGNTKVFDQVDKKMTLFISDKLNVTKEEAKRIQKNYFYEHDTTLNGMIKNHQINAQEFLDFVHDVDLEFLKEDKGLQKELISLDGKKFIFTNGSKSHAANVTKKIGIQNIFDGVFDIVDADFIPKPSIAPYKKIIEKYRIDPKYCIFIEDIARNLKPANELGMKTAWIKNNEPWAAEFSNESFIDYKINNLSEFLRRINEQK
jgi:putative hydrolase of the HAD superfamily